jgi:hypothetical protein
VNEGRSVRVEVNSRNKRELSGKLFPPFEAQNSLLFFKGSTVFDCTRRPVLIICNSLHFGHLCLLPVKNNV